ncbi:MAG TPA: oxidoreductase [Nevskiaceae bacterium]|nr:oxidoreductase [Nevskiaceae bacterium]
MSGIRGWSLADVPDQSGRIAIVTGANTGIGWWTAFGLASRGAHVVLACRSMPNADAAAARLRAAVPAARVETQRLDVSDLASVHAFADAILARHPRLDLLVNNAGIAWAPQQASAQGHELHLATNFLGPFALTARLVDRLKATPGARIVNVGSNEHHAGRLDFDDLDWQRRTFASRLAYAQSKVAMLSFTLELDRRLRRASSGLVALAAHPGFSSTDIARNSRMPLMDWWIGRLSIAIAARIFQGAEAGAMPLLDAATNPALAGGAYRGPQRWFGTTGDPGPARVAKAARDPDAARRLWTCAETMTGTHFPDWLA